MLKQEQVILVDEFDQMLGLEEKLIAHQQGLLHRAFSIFIYRYHEASIELLLQQRSQHKYHGQGLWSNTCCSHPREHESIVEAAHRRLHEEMSLKIPLQWIGSFQYYAKLDNGLIENEFDHVFIGEYQNESNESNESSDPNNAILFDKEEVQSIRWMPMNELSLELEHNPEFYTPWLKGVLNIVEEKLCILC